MDGAWVAGAAGHIELGETAAATAMREAAEEIGVVITPVDLQPATVMQRTDGTGLQREQRVDWFFTARSWAGEPTIREPQKCADLRWFNLDELPSAISSYERLVLDAIARDSVPPFTSFGFA
jgi:ADP-ribose pyrophosphatase YjhB (NUDIX family)